MKILITGSTGLIGRDLIPALRKDGHQVVRLSRHPAPRDNTEIGWNPAKSEMDANRLEGFDAVIHLAGETLEGRWTEEKKKRIYDSRVQSTQLLSDTLAKLNSPPQTLITASGVGFYGDRGDEHLDENSGMGEGFLAELCRDWEGATAPARERGIRVVTGRFGIVLSPRGGALPKMLMPFKFGVGGPFGTGQQYWSWIAIDDLVGGLRHILEHPEISGPVNFVAPQPLTNAEFARALGRAVSRPALLPLPAPLTYLILGEFADSLFASTRVLPQVLLDTQYAFRFTDLDSALDHLLQR